MDLSKSILKQFLTSRDLGSVEFDRHFQIVAVDATASRILRSLGHADHEKRLLDVFPELIGSEDIAQEIINTQSGNLRLDYINRTDPSGQPVFVNLIVLGGNTPGCGLVIIENVTYIARAIQAMNQQRYDLFLYQRNQEFRTEFLNNSILGNSKAILKVRETIQKISSFPNATVLLMGETGTGKNLAARVVHLSSMPRAAPFVHINCAALPEHLIEAELFGYEKGSFTHAITARPGLFEEAGNGSIFLDEIGEIPLYTQAKLLSVLETKQVRRLGSNKTIDVNARIIAATNKDLQKAVQQKTFREDLFYRLNIVFIDLPPLRKMGDDIILIAEYLRKRFNVEFGKQVRRFSTRAKKLLLDYTWPGNVRELSNCIERAMIFNESNSIEPESLTISNQFGDPPLDGTQQFIIPPDGINLEDVERRLITAALKQAGNNKSKAARLIGLTRDTLRYRLEKYNLS
jgi:transcriptional regulator with PAS, ATPase and Fis domain